MQQSNFYVRYIYHTRQTITLSIPVIIGQLGHVLMQVIDNLMIGDLGFTHLSACSLATSVFFIIIVLGYGITSIISPLVAQRRSSGNLSECGNILYQGFWVSLATSILLSCIVYKSADLLYLLDQPEEDVALANSYLKILSFSVIPMLLFMAYKSFTDGLENTQLGMIITLLGLIINTLLNYVLIYGYLGFPRLALDGAGYGTTISRYVMMILIILIVHLSKKYTSFFLNISIKRIDKRLIVKILTLGIPAGFQYLFEAGAFVGVAVMIGWIGSAERAAHQIVINLASITYMVVTGLATGASIRVGSALGRKNIEEVKESGLTGILLSIIFMLIASIVFIKGKYFFPKLYVDEENVIQLSAELMIIAAFFQIFDGIQAVGIGILRGIQDVKIPTWITFVSYWIIALPLAYILGIYLDLGLPGTWYALVVGLFIAGVALTFRFFYLTLKYKN